MILNIVSWNMQGTGERFRQKFSTMMSFYIREPNVINVFCIQECGSPETIRGQEHYYERQLRNRLVTYDFQNAFQTDAKGNVFGGVSFIGSDGGYVVLNGFCSWNEADRAKRCGTAIFYDVLYNNADLEYINLERCNTDFVHNGVLQNGRRPFIKLSFGAGGKRFQIYSAHANANGNAKQQVNNFLQNHADEDPYAYTVFAGDFNHQPCSTYYDMYNNPIAVSRSKGVATQGRIINGMSRSRELDFFIINRNLCNVICDCHVYRTYEFSYDDRINMLSPVDKDKNKAADGSEDVFLDESIGYGYDYTDTVLAENEDLYTLSDHDIVQMVVTIPD